MVIIMTPKFLIIISGIILGLLSQTVYAESTYAEKLEFAESLEETLGHFWAIEKNLDENNAELALVHATHPISELYGLIKPELEEHDPDFDAKVKNTLMELGKKTGSTVNRADAQKALNDAKEIIEQARILVIGKDLSSDTSFQLDLIKGLLKTSGAEYDQAMSNGEIINRIEFQDGSAFVWKSKQIFDKIRKELPGPESEKIEEFYTELWGAYNKGADPENIETLVDSISHEINEIQGVEETGELQVYVENIDILLTQVKTEYQNGNSDISLRLATQAYLDNFEFLEKPLKEAGQEELVKEMEVMMRIELRDMIKNKASTSEINSKVDDILENMKIVEVNVPEFGSVVMVTLIIAIIGVVVVTKKNRLNVIPQL
jgi:predicted secreted protein with PEFG-CTERM motif